jgi:hypothetical protein
MKHYSRLVSKSRVGLDEDFMGDENVSKCGNNQQKTLSEVRQQQVVVASSNTQQAQLCSAEGGRF